VPTCSPLRSKLRWCREPEVRTPHAASAIANFGSKAGLESNRLEKSSRPVQRWSPNRIACCFHQGLAILRPASPCRSAITITAAPARGGDAGGENGARSLRRVTAIQPDSLAGQLPHARTALAKNWPRNAKPRRGEGSWPRRGFCARTRKDLRNLPSPSIGIIAHPRSTVGSRSDSGSVWKNT